MARVVLAKACQLHIAKHGCVRYSTEAQAVMNEAMYEVMTSIHEAGKSLARTSDITL